MWVVLNDEAHLFIILLIFRSEVSWFSVRFANIVDVESWGMAEKKVTFIVWGFKKRMLSPLSVVAEMVPGVRLVEANQTSVPQPQYFWLRNKSESRLKP